jgi:succinate dehydrogenase/fumarate reductase cytochrome b subunit
MTASFVNGFFYAGFYGMRKSGIESWKIKSFDGGYLRDRSWSKVIQKITYLSNKIQNGKTWYSEEQVISMLDFLIDNICVSFGGALFQQVVGIPMDTNCAPLLVASFVNGFFYAGFYGMRKSGIESWKIKSFDGGYLRDRSWSKVIQKIFRVFQNQHVSLDT